MDDMSGPFLVISRHDFRSPRKANMHFITECLAERGTTRFFSFGFSHLSRLKRDPRMTLWDRANVVETFNGVETYLWRTPLHPVNLRRPALQGVEAALFRAYVRLAPQVLKDWIRASSTILLESGFPVIFIRLCATLNPRARIIYIASDGLRTIDCAEFIVREFDQTAHLLHGLRLPSRRLYDEMPNPGAAYVVPHGLDPGLRTNAEPSPYGPGRHAVSVGSMLFDPSFFQIAAAAFPDVTFHVIGGGQAAAGLVAPNVRVLDEMRFADTVPYIRHADFGIAPYTADKVAPYLVDTSMKLMQYGFLGVPAVCPDVVAGDRPGRFGYRPGDGSSITAAVERALAFGHFEGSEALGWREVTDRILLPEKFADTAVFPDG